MARRSDAAASPAAESEGEDEEPKPEPGGGPKPKGHGRNGASAFRAAQHDFYALALGVIGAVCTACQIGKMYRYREKIILRIVGQPMFRAEQHHHEQARCRNCGRVVRADGPACVHEGVGTEYIRYDWSACAMLLFMHYTGGHVKTESLPVPASNIEIQAVAAIPSSGGQAIAVGFTHSSSGGGLGSDVVGAILQYGG